MLRTGTMLFSLTILSAYAAFGKRSSISVGGGARSQAVRRGEIESQRRPAIHDSSYTGRRRRNRLSLQVVSRRSGGEQKAARRVHTRRKTPRGASGVPSLPCA